MKSTEYIWINKNDKSIDFFKYPCVIGSEWWFKFNAGRSFQMFVGGLEKCAKVSKSFHYIFVAKKLWNFILIYTLRGLGWSDSTRRIWPHAVRQHLIRPCRCLKLHFMPCATSDNARSWNRTRPQPRDRPRQCAQTFILWSCPSFLLFCKLNVWLSSEWHTKSYLVVQSIIHNITYSISNQQ